MLPLVGCSHSDGRFTWKKERHSRLHTAPIAARPECDVLRCIRPERDYDVFRQICDIIASGENARLDAGSYIPSRVESYSQAVLNTVGVAVDRLPGEVGRVMEFRRRVASGYFRVTGGALRQSKRAAQSSILIFVVERENPIGRVLRRTHRESPQAGVTRGIGVDVQRVVGASAGPDGRARVVRAFSSKDLDDSGYRV